ncbi:MAG: sigma-70 family RNA polymerase sigma factor [Ruminococcaceae bacterium]|nr:sigma-70 family RNA polymerase sigma factor [Oscillospiraceae bacterium]
MNYNVGMKEELLREFSENYMEKLFYFCLRKVSDSYEAEDLCSDIMLCVVSALGEGTIPENFSAWVWRIAKNRYARWADAKAKKGVTVTGADVSEYELLDEGESIEEKIIHREELSLLRRELAFISSDYRNIVVAYYIDDRSVRDIAKENSLPEGTVKSKLSRARKILKEGMNMAREFGTLSYRPENVGLMMNGTSGWDNAPGCFFDRLMCKNIMLAAYRNPSTAKELAIEVGVALPYMEEELYTLAEAELLRRNGDKFETNFPIISKQAQEKMGAHLKGCASEYADTVIEYMEKYIAALDSAVPQWRWGEQSREEMKWYILLQFADELNYDLCKDRFEGYSEEELSKVDRKWGTSIRKNGGAWDIVGLETGAVTYTNVGLHGCEAPPERSNDPYIIFRQFKIDYKDIWKKTPIYLTYEQGEALVAVAKGDASNIAKRVLEKLCEYGYIKEKDGKWLPALLVMNKELMGKNSIPKEKNDELDVLIKKAWAITERHSNFIRETILADVPEFIREERWQIDNAVRSFSCMARCAVLDTAIEKGYLAYDENTATNALGAALIL